MSVRRIAKEAGVSPATVSRVLNSSNTVDPVVRELVLKIANEQRYVASRGNNRPMNLAIAYLGDVNAGGLLSSPFDIALLQGMAKMMGSKRFTLSFINAPESRLHGESYTQMFHRCGIQGAVLRSMSGYREDCIEIATEGFPSVVVAERFDEPEVSWIDCNSKTASMQGVTKLIEMGHRHIAFSCFDKTDQDHTDRFEGYLEALKANGIEADPSMQIRAAATRESGARLLKRLLAHTPRPTAVFITDPLVALGFLGEAQRTSVKIPEDISVLGFDDSQLRYDSFPKLSAVCQDVEQLGASAAEILSELVASENVAARQVEVSAWIELHETVTEPPGNPIAS